MRRLNTKPKDRLKRPIPAELKDALAEVHELIRQSKHDPDLVLDFDDAIQCGPVCGGRVGPKKKPYVLTYYPTDAAAQGRWSLALHGTEIEDIADGRMTEIMMSCCVSPDCRRAFREADDVCGDCDYEEVPGFGTFAFPAAVAILTERGVTGISDDSTRADVLALLGPADATGGDGRRTIIGPIWPWVVYRRADCQVRFEFTKSGSKIRNVTIMDKDFVPGR